MLYNPLSSNIWKWDLWSITEVPTKYLTYSIQNNDSMCDILYNFANALHTVEWALLLFDQGAATGFERERQFQLSFGSWRQMKVPHIYTWRALYTLICYWNRMFPYYLTCNSLKNKRITATTALLIYGMI